MFNLFNVFKKSVENTIKRDVISNSKVTTPISKPVNKMDKVVNKKYTYNPYSKAEITYLKSLKGKCKSWNDVTKIYNTKFPLNKRTLQSLKGKVEGIYGTSSNFTLNSKNRTSVDMHKFLLTHSKGMTIDEITEVLAKSFNVKKERDTIHTYIVNNGYKYKQVFKRRKDLDKVVLDLYNKVDLKYGNKRVYGWGQLQKLVSEYYGEPVSKASINNVLYRNGIKHCESMSKAIKELAK